MKLKELFVELGLDIDEDSWELGDNKITDLRNLLDMLAGAARKAGDFISEMLKGTADAASQIDDTSQRLGVNAQALQELSYAAKLSGSSQEELTLGLTTLSRTLYAASKGSEEAAGAFTKLGIKIRDSKGQLRTADDVFSDIAKNFSKAKSDTEQAGLAMTFFGKAGANLVPLLKEGSEGIAQLRSEAVRLGFVMDDATIAAGARFGDSLDNAHFAMESLRDEIAGPFLSAASDALDSFTEWVVANREWIASGIRDAIEALADITKFFFTVLRGGMAVLRYFAPMVKHLGTALKVLGVVLGLVAVGLVGYGASMLVAQLATMAAVAGGILPMIAALLSMAAATVIAAAPFFALGAAILGVVAAIALLAEDVYGFATGKNSLLGQVLAGFELFWKSLEKKATSIPVLNELLTTLQLIKAEVQAIASLWDKIAPQWLKDAAAQMKPTVGTAVGAGVSALPIPGAQVLGSYISFGGGDSPTASANAAAPAAQRSVVNAPSNVSVTVNAAPGMNPNDVADAVSARIEDARKTELRKTAAALGTR